jgi:hypothetical protein
MIDMHDIIRQLAANAEAIRALVQTVPEEQAQWKPGQDAWSLSEVMSHVYNEERVDFRPHIKGLLTEPSKPWSAYYEPWLAENNHQQALASFLLERAASIAWLKTLAVPDWDATTAIRFGPSSDKMTLSVGELLVSWVDHDYLHVRQINELLHAWNAKQASPYSVDYAGGW